MQGVINGTVSLTGALSSQKQLIGGIVGAKSLHGTANIPQQIPVPEYEGVYEATPTANAQVFETADKKMRSDFTVNATPYSEVSNIYGGYTVTIL